MSVRHASRSIVDIIPISRPSSYVCRQCRHNLRTPSQISQQRRFASKGPEDNTEQSKAGESRTEKLRRALWKGKPPGPENIDDVYGGPGFFATVSKERKKRSAKQKEGSESNTEFDQVKAREAQAAEQLRIQEKEGEIATQTEPEVLDEQIVAVGPDSTEIRTWDGLRAIGHLGDWREMPVKAADSYVPWTYYGEKKVWTHDQLVSLMHQAIVSVFALREADLLEDRDAVIDMSNPAVISAFSQATIAKADDGYLWKVEFGSAESAIQKNLKSGAWLQKSGVTPITTPYEPADTSFLDGRILLPHFDESLPIIQKFTSLTQHRIPDPLLTALGSQDTTKNTFRYFLQQFAEVTKAKPVNLADILLQDETLAAQSNLLIMPRRETPVDKEKEVGRWKIIEAELKARGLPVLGKVEIQR